jgi:hypothetical protein
VSGQLQWQIITGQHFLWLRRHHRLGLSCEGKTCKILCNKNKTNILKTINCVTSFITYHISHITYHISPLKVYNVLKVHVYLRRDAASLALIVPHLRSPNHRRGFQSWGISFFLNNQPDALIIQIYSVIKLYMFRVSSVPIIRSFLLYVWHW